MPVPDQDDWDLDTDLMEHETELNHAPRRERKSISKGDRTFMEQMNLKDEEARKRKEVLHDKDAPPEFKRTKYQYDPAGVAQLPQIAMHATTYTNGTGRSDESCTSRSEWFDRYQTGGLGVLMNKVIKGVRIHSQPRQKLYDHKRHKKFNRLDR